uniref:Uncharacterized protein n=1 Tax=Anopheles farauti TaxID=69004 RepID=A0A182QFU7_9DIPT
MRWSRRRWMPLVLVVLGVAAVGQCDDATTTLPPVTESVGMCRCTSEKCVEEFDKCAVDEEQLTTVFEVMDRSESVPETTTHGEEDILMSTTTTTTTTTTTPSTTTTSTRPPRTHGRMVRFGGRRRMARPTTTTAEPQRSKPTVSSRTLQNRRGLFNPELRNRYLGRFRGSTTADPDT